jgi:hypothetical protein
MLHDALRSSHPLQALDGMNLSPLKFSYGTQRVDRAEEPNCDITIRRDRLALAKISTNRPSSDRGHGIAQHFHRIRRGTCTKASPFERGLFCMSLTTGNANPSHFRDILLTTAKKKSVREYHHCCCFVFFLRFNRWQLLVGQRSGTKTQHNPPQKQKPICSLISFAGLRTKSTDRTLNRKKGLPFQEFCWRKREGIRSRTSRGCRQQFCAMILISGMAPPAEWLGKPGSHPFDNTPNE